MPKLYSLILEIRCADFSYCALGTAEGVQWPFEIPIRLASPLGGEDGSCANTGGDLRDGIFSPRRRWAGSRVLGIPVPQGANLRWSPRLSILGVLGNLAMVRALYAAGAVPFPRPTLGSVAIGWLALPTALLGAVVLWWEFIKFVRERHAAAQQANEPDVE